MKRISIFFPATLLKDVDILALTVHKKRSEIIRQAVEELIARWRLTVAPQSDEQVEDFIGELQREHDIEF